MSENTVIVEDFEKDIPKVELKETRNMENKDLKTERENGIKAERKRLTGLRKVADQVRHLYPEVDAMVEDFSNSERTLDEFNAAIVAKMNQVETATLEARTGEAELGMSKNDLDQYSLTRLIVALDSGDWSKAGLELEASRAYADMTGNIARGAFVPFDVLNQTRANETTSSTAGSLIATDFWGSSFIDMLRARSVVAGAGARMVTGLVGNVDIPKASNSASFGWTAENVNVARTAMAMETVNLSPETIGGEVAITRKMIKQTGNPAIEAMIRNDLNLGVSQFLDATALTGAGTGVIPEGITVNADVNQVTGTTLTWAKAVELETAVATANADFGKLSYITNPFVRGLAKTKVKDSGSSMGFIMQGDGTINGYNVACTTAVGANLIFGNFDDLILAMWGGIDIDLDKSALGGSGGLVLRCFLDADVKFRNEESFSVMKSIAT